MTTTLAELEHHRPATIIRVGGERSFRRRLMELGLLPGATLTVTNVAPFGGPMQLAVRDFRLSIRQSEAALVEVVLT